MPSLQSQRTVYRLTLVKEWNVEQLEGYASLVTRGDPDFIEVKVKKFTSPTFQFLHFTLCPLFFIHSTAFYGIDCAYACMPFMVLDVRACVVWGLPFVSVCELLA